MVNQVNQSSEWKVKGDYFEACNCNSICPCVFLADPDKEDCQLTIAWHVNEGHYGSTKLDNLNVVGIFHTPGNMANGPKWRAAVYLDDRANKDQAEALGKIFSGQVGGFPKVVAGFIGEILGVKTTKIAFEVDGKKRRLSIPDILELKVEGTPGGNPEKEPTITNPALYGAPGFDPVVAKSTEYTYRDHKLDWGNSGKNAFYSNFSYTP